MQVDIMVWFQGLFENFTGFFDVFFAFVTFFGEELVMLVFLPVAYWAFNKELAHFVGLAGFTSLTLNGVIKDAAAIQRPIGNPEIRFVEIENFFVDTVHLKNGSYSFPSGHSQTVSVMSFSIASFFNKKKIWIGAITITLLVMMSRMYLGVHWPLDVLVGGLLGLISAVVCYKILTKYKDPDIRVRIYLIAAVLCLAALFVAEKSDTYKTVGACMGFALGALFERKLVNFNPKEGEVWKKIVRCVLGLVIILGLRLGLKPLFALISDAFFMDFIRYMILVFFAMGLYPFIFKKLKL